MRTSKIGKDIVWAFDGFNDLAKVSTEMSDPTKSSQTGSPRFCGGTKTLEEANKLLVDGWHKPLKELYSITDRVREQIAEIVAPVLQFQQGVTGCRVDIGLYSAGDPQCFYSFYEEDGKRADRFVRILVDASFSSGVNPDDIVTRGATVIALCDALNICGYSTEVWVTTATGNTHARTSKTRFGYILVPVQRAGEEWDVKSSIYPLSHASFIRRTGFAIREQDADIIENFGSSNSYGYPTGVIRGDTIDEYVGGADIILSGQVGSISDIIRNPSKWVLDQLVQCGALLPQNV